MRATKSDAREPVPFENNASSPLPFLFPARIARPALGISRHVVEELPTPSPPKIRTLFNRINKMEIDVDE